MSVVVAGLFDTQSQATEAMDRLLKQNIEDLDTHVIEPGMYSDSSRPGTVIAPIPNTSGTGSGLPAVPGPFIAGSGAAGGAFGWLNDMDEVERVFYQEGMREGATLALAKVDDDHAEHVRQLFRQSGARTYVKD